MFLDQFQSLPVGLLALSAGVSIATGGALDAAVIMSVVLINAGIGFLTERQAERTIAALGKVTPLSATVLRDGAEREVAVQDVVPGDVLVLSPGSYVAADVRLLASQRLTLDESALTGESLPVSKDAASLGTPDTPLADRRNMAYMGTMVTGGGGRGVAVATAKHTEIGQIQSLVSQTQAPATPMQRELDQLGFTLSILSGAVCAAVFGAGLLRGLGWLEMLKGSVSLAVAAVPEGLPAVATTTLALGIEQMRKHKVAVRHLDAVETLGAVAVFCLDKTGTLTQNRMRVVALSSGLRRLSVDEQNRFIDQGEFVEPRARREIRRALEIVVLCNETELNGPADSATFNGTPTETALLELSMAAGIDARALRRHLPLLHIRHRAEGRPYMSTIHRLPNAKRLLAVKGNPAEVLARSRDYLADGEVLPLSDAVREEILRANEHMAAEALRILGVAYRIDGDPNVHSETLTWLGAVAMADPLRSGMQDLMALFHRAGIATVMITGDQSATAYAIGRELNLSNSQPLEILDSTTLERLDPELLAGLASRVHVFARVSPAHKLRIVQALQRAGNVVAMTGDGINDGPALKAADIGVAMGAAGTEAARTVADVVLEDDNLHTMAVGVGQGRTIYANIRKTLHFLLATNFTEIEVMLVGIALGLGQPLNPMQLLWINLVSDIFPGLALSLEPPEPQVLEEPPRNPREPIIPRRDLARMGLESAVITAGTLASYAYALTRYGPGPQAGSQAFTTLTVGQLLHAISCRSRHHSLYKRPKQPPNPSLRVALLSSLLAQLLIGVVPGLRKLLGITPLGLTDVLVVGVGATVPLLVNEALKHLALFGGPAEATGLPTPSKGSPGSVERISQNDEQ
jgi:Ca2+-transporting ATPase